MTWNGDKSRGRLSVSLPVACFACIMLLKVKFGGWTDTEICQASLIFAIAYLNIDTVLLESYVKFYYSLNCSSYEITWENIDLILFQYDVTVNEVQREPISGLLYDSTVIIFAIIDCCKSGPVLCAKSQEAHLEKVCVTVPEGLWSLELINGR
jgi:hypothetical protein